MSVEAPRIPDSAALDAVRRVCEETDPYSVGATHDALFVEAMREITRWHAERSPFYARLLARRGFSPADLREAADLARLPLVPAEFFKTHTAVSVPPEKVILTLTSSGTTGQKSQMSFDEWSIRAPQRMVQFQFERWGWHTPAAPANYLLYTYETAAGSRLGTSYTDHFLCGFAPVNEAFCALRLTGGAGGHEFDAFGCIAALERWAQDEHPVRIFGFPAFLWFTLRRMRELGHPPLRLPAGSLIFLGGGWKGHAGEAIASTELYALAAELLGIPGERIRDGFGSVEHCIPYFECPRHRFHVPTWSRVFTRDVETLAPLPFGERGFLHFVSPYITSAPAHSVMMGDLASLHPADDCGCGIATPFFLVHGRAGTSRNKSCAIAAAELLRGRQA